MASAETNEGSLKDRLGKIKNEQEVSARSLKERLLRQQIAGLQDRAKRLEELRDALKTGYEQGGKDLAGFKTAQQEIKNLYADHQALIAENFGAQTEDEFFKAIHKNKSFAEDQEVQTYQAASQAIRAGAKARQAANKDLKQEFGEEIPNLNLRARASQAEQAKAAEEGRAAPNPRAEAMAAVDRRLTGLKADIQRLLEQTPEGRQEIENQVRTSVIKRAERREPYLQTDFNVSSASLIDSQDLADADRFGEGGEGFMKKLIEDQVVARYGKYLDGAKELAILDKGFGALNKLEQEQKELSPLAQDARDQTEKLINDLARQIQDDTDLRRRLLGLGEREDRPEEVFQRIRARIGVRIKNWLGREGLLGDDEAKRNKYETLKTIWEKFQYREHDSSRVSEDLATAEPLALMQTNRTRDQKGLAERTKTGGWGGAEQPPHQKEGLTNMQFLRAYTEEWQKCLEVMNEAKAQDIAVLLNRDTNSWASFIAEKARQIPTSDWGNGRMRISADPEFAKIIGEKRESDASNWHRQLRANREEWEGKARPLIAAHIDVLWAALARNRFTENRQNAAAIERGQNLQKKKEQAKKMAELALQAAAAFAEKPQMNIRVWRYERSTYGGHSGVKDYNFSIGDHDERINKLNAQMESQEKEIRDLQNQIYTVSQESDGLFGGNKAKKRARTDDLESKIRNLRRLIETANVERNKAADEKEELHKTIWPLFKEGAPEWQTVTTRMEKTDRNSEEAKLPVGEVLSGIVKETEAMSQDQLADPDAKIYSEYLRLVKEYEGAQKRFKDQASKQRGRDMRYL